MIVESSFLKAYCFEICELTVLLPRGVFQEKSALLGLGGGFWGVRPVLFAGVVLLVSASCWRVRRGSGRSAEPLAGCCQGLELRESPRERREFICWALWSQLPLSGFVRGNETSVPGCQLIASFWVSCDFLLCSFISPRDRLSSLLLNIIMWDLPF